MQLVSSNRHLFQAHKKRHMEKKHQPQWAPIADEWAGPFSVIETWPLVTVVLMFIISSRMMIKYRDNYSKPTWGLARLHFAYPWYKTYHFAPLYFNPLPPLLSTWPSDVSLTPFYSKLEHNTDQIGKILSFLHEP